MGLPLPPTAQRFEHPEDALKLAEHMWTGDQEPFHGHHDTLEAPETCPAPLSTPHPPIVIGGSGEQRTLRLVARYTDAANLSSTSLPDTLVIAWLCSRIH